jgi:hypothetical protein
MKDRISFSPDAAFKSSYFGHLDALIVMGNTMIAGTSPDDIKGGQKMGDGGGLTFVKDGVALARDNRKLIDDGDASSLEDFEGDANLVIFILEVDQKLTIINGQVNQAYILVSKDLMEQANWVLAELRKRKSSPTFGPLYERLNALYAKRAERAAATTSQKAETDKKLAEAEAKVAAAEAKMAEIAKKA